MTLGRLILLAAGRIAFIVILAFCLVVLLSLLKKPS